MNEKEKLARQWAERIKSVPREYHDEMHHAVADFVLAHTGPETMEGREWVHAEHHMAGAYWEGDIPVVMIDPVDEGKTTVLTVEEESIHEADDSDLTPNGKRYELSEVTVSSNENVEADQCEQPERSYTVQTSLDQPPTDDSWVEVDYRGMYRDDYMEWKPRKWYALEGEPMTIEEAVEAVGEGLGYKRPYRIKCGGEVALTVFPEPEVPDHPEVLATAEDYKNAPVGTIVATSYSQPFYKHGAYGTWIRSLDERDSIEMADSVIESRVLRWGGEA